MNEKKFPEPIEALMIIIGVFAVLILLSSIIVVWQNPSEVETNIKETSKLFYVIGGLAFLIIPVIYVRIRGYDMVEIFRLRPVSSEIFMLSIVLALASVVVSDEADRLIQMLVPLPDWFEQQMETLRAVTTGDWILVIFAAVVLAAVSEEMLFRGFLQISLEKKGDVTKAVILSSLAWTLVHLNIYWAIQIFVLGVIMGFVSWRTNSVIPSMMVHGINNLISLLVLNLELDTKMDWYLMGDHVSPFVLVPAILVLVWSIRKITAAAELRFE